MENRINNSNSIVIQRGDIVYADFGKNTTTQSSLQEGVRPSIVISNDVGNHFSPVCILIPLTGSTTKKSLPTHVQIIKDNYNNLDKTSIALLEQVITLPKSKILDKIGKCSPIIMKEIEKALKISLAITDMKTEKVNIPKKEIIIEKEHFDRTRVTDIAETINGLEEFCNKYSSIDLRDIKASIKTHLYELKKYCAEYEIAWKFFYKSKLITKQNELISKLG